MQLGQALQLVVLGACAYAAGYYHSQRQLRDRHHADGDDDHHQDESVPREQAAAAAAGQPSEGDGARKKKRNRGRKRREEDEAKAMERGEDVPEKPLYRTKPVFPPGPPPTREEWERRKQIMEEFKAEQRRIGKEVTERQRQEQAEAKAAAAAAAAAAAKAQQEAQQENLEGSKEWEVVSDGEGEGEGEGEEGADKPGEVPLRVRRAETVLRARTSRFILVLEACHDNRNQQAVLRTAEAMGVQAVWIVQAASEKNRVIAQRIVKGSTSWLTIRRFQSTPQLMAALREEGYTVWATDLHPTAIPLSSLLPSASQPSHPVPERLAVVIGREADGVSPAILSACDQRVYIEMFGFTGSFNLSVAAALILQSLFLACPEARGDLPEDARCELRRKWFSKLNKSKSDPNRYDVWVQLAEQGKVGGVDDLRVDDANNMPRIPPKLQKKLGAARMEGREAGDAQ